MSQTNPIEPTARCKGCGATSLNGILTHHENCIAYVPTPSKEPNEYVLVKSVPAEEFDKNLKHTTDKAFTYHIGATPLPEELTFRDEVTEALKELLSENGAELMNDRLAHPSLNTALDRITLAVSRHIISSEEPYKPPKALKLTPQGQQQLEKKWAEQDIRNALRAQQRTALGGGKS